MDMPQDFIEQTVKFYDGVEVVTQVRSFITAGMNLAFSGVASPVYVVCKTFQKFTFCFMLSEDYVQVKVGYHLIWIMLRGSQ